LTQRCYTETEVRDALAAAGFAETTAREAERDLGMRGNVGRMFFLTGKAARH